MVYVPGTGETDHKKQNQSLQAINAAQVTAQTSIDTNTTNIATNTTNITTNTTNIASNTSAISALQAGPLVSGAVAAKSDEVTATSTTLATTPGRQQFHPSAAKAWVEFTTVASPVIGASFNVSSVTKSSTGNYVVNFTTSFTSTSYSVVVTTEPAAAFGWGSISSGGRATGSVSVSALTVSAGSPAFHDPTTVMVACFGTQ